MFARFKNLRIPAWIVVLLVLVFAGLLGGGYAYTQSHPKVIVKTVPAQQNTSIVGRSYHPQAFPEWDLRVGSDRKFTLRGGNTASRLEWSIELEAGTWRLLGPCEIHLDEDRNGRGSLNPTTAGYGGTFQVRPATGSTIAWAWLTCNARTIDTTATVLEQVGP